jgi:hypothetical protein
MSNNNPLIGWQQWSSDSKSVYVADAGHRLEAAVFDRVRIPDGKVERVATVEVREGITGYWAGWLGTAPDGSPLLLRDLSIQEVYALDVGLP